MSEFHTWSHEVSEIFTAVGTVAVAVLAIWGDQIRARLVGPKLQLRLRDRHGERTDVTGHGPARFYHLAVSNARRHAPAHNVRVVLTSVTRPAADGTIQSEKLAGHLQLSWQHGHSLPQFLTVGSEANADLGFILKQGMFQLSPVFMPNNFKPAVMRGQTMIIEAIATSDETESAPLQLQISWDGAWSDDAAEMAKHLVIKELPA